VAVVEDHAYVADMTGGLRVISVSEPANPIEVGYYVRPGYAYGVTVVGEYAYVAHGDVGLQIYQFYGAGVEERETLDAGRTTPIPTIVRGVLELPSGKPGQSTPGQSLVFLLDISGRKVLNLHPGPNDVSGLAAGVYFVRGRGSGGGGRGEVRKVVIQR
jgi:hypothetical protein